MTKAEAKLLANYLSEEPDKGGSLQGLEDFMVSMIPKPRQRHLLMFFGVGGVLGFFGALILVVVVQRFRLRQGR
jgi:hypothetical protein